MDIPVDSFITEYKKVDRAHICQYEAWEMRNPNKTHTMWVIYYLFPSHPLIKIKKGEQNV